MFRNNSAELTWNCYSAEESAHSEPFITWKISFTKNLSPANRIENVFLSAKCFGTEFWEYASNFVPQNGISSSFLFRRMVQNRIPESFFVSVQNSDHFSPLLNGSKRISERFFRRIIFLSEIANPSSAACFWRPIPGVCNGGGGGCSIFVSQ